MFCDISPTAFLLFHLVSRKWFSVSHIPAFRAYISHMYYQLSYIIAFPSCSELYIHFIFCANFIVSPFFFSTHHLIYMYVVVLCSWIHSTSDEFSSEILSGLLIFPWKPNSNKTNPKRFYLYTVSVANANQRCVLGFGFAQQLQKIWFPANLDTCKCCSAVLSDYIIMCFQMPELFF